MLSKKKTIINTNLEQVSSIGLVRGQKLGTSKGLVSGSSKGREERGP